MCSALIALFERTGRDQIPDKQNCIDGRINQKTEITERIEADVEQRKIATKA